MKEIKHNTGVNSETSTRPVSLYFENFVGVLVPVTPRPLTASKNNPWHFNIFGRIYSQIILFIFSKWSFLIVLQFKIFKESMHTYIQTCICNNSFFIYFKPICPTPWAWTVFSAQRLRGAFTLGERINQCRWLR